MELPNFDEIPHQQQNFGTHKGDRRSTHRSVRFNAPDITSTAVNSWRAPRCDSRLLEQRQGGLPARHPAPRLGSQMVTNLLQLGAHLRFGCCSWCCAFAGCSNPRARITTSEQPVGEPRSTRVKESLPDHAKRLLGRHGRAVVQLAAQIVPRATGTATVTDSAS